MKTTICFFLLFMTSVSYAGSTSYCRIGSDPVNTARQLDHYERVVLMNQETMVRMGSGSGKAVTCMLRKGEPVVVNTRSGKAIWVYRCGNPIMAIAINPAPARKVSQKIVGMHYTPPAQQDPGLNSAFNDCPVGGSCSASLRAFAGGVIGGVGIYALTRSLGSSSATAVAGGGTASGGSSGGGGTGGGPVGGGGTGGSGGGPVGGGGTP